MNQTTFHVNVTIVQPNEAYDENIEWLLQTPPLVLAFISLVCLFVLRHANKVDQMRIKHSGPAEIKKRSNDYFILSLLNALILSDLAFVLFFSSNYFPFAFGADMYPDIICIIVAMGIQLFSLYSFSWHLLLSCYLLALLMNYNPNIKLQLLRFKFKLCIKNKLCGDRERSKHNYNYNYDFDKYNFHQMQRTFFITQTGLIIFCILCTIIPLQFDAYGSYYVYYDKYDNKYSKQCWIDENNRFDLIVYIFGIIILLAQFVVFLFALYKLSRANSHSLGSMSNISNSNYNFSNAPIPHSIEMGKKDNSNNIPIDHDHGDANTMDAMLDGDTQKNSGLLSKNDNDNDNDNGDDINTVGLTEAKRSNSAYKHLIIQLSYWNGIYGLFCVLCALQRTVHIVAVVLGADINIYENHDLLFLGIIHNWGLVTIGIVDAIVWCLNKITFKKYQFEKMVQHQKLLDDQFNVYYQERNNAYQQIQLANEKDIISGFTTTSDLPQPLSVRFGTGITSYNSGDPYKHLSFGL